MVKTEIVMKRILTFVAALFLAFGLSAQEYSWKAVPMDGSRVGCRYATPEDKDESIGKIEKGAYIAPNGVKFKKNSDVTKVASLVLDAQPAMAAKKEREEARKTKAEMAAAKEQEKIIEEILREYLA